MKPHIYKRSLYLGVCLAACVLGLTALSQGAFAAPAQVPASAEANRVRTQVGNPDIEQKGTPEINIPAVRSEMGPAGSSNVKFTLKSLEIQGVSAYSQAQLAPLYQEDIGHTITVARLYEIANDITKKYRNDGYVISQTVVPVQTIEGGDVKLLVVEGTLDQIVVEGKVTDLDGGQIRALSNKLKASQPLRSKDLERYLLLINDLPGVSARSIIGPSPSATGKADMRIIVDRDPANFMIGGDNYGSPYLGPWEITAAAQINNVLGIDDSVTAQLVTAPNDDELYYLYGAYARPIGSDGMTITTDITYSDTEPGYDVRIFGAQGFSTTIGATLEYPIIRSRNENLSVRGRFETETSSTKSDLGVTTDDDTRSVRLGAHYEKLSNMLGTSVNMADFQVSHGLNIFGASDKNDPDLSRADGNPEYTKFELEMTRLQRIVKDFNVLVGVKAQHATSALLSGEEFGLGGMNYGYGRGYDPSEVVGEDGLAGKLELQWNMHAFDQTVKSVQLFTFYDVGTVWNTDATTSADKRNSIASAGFGARTHLNDILSADATLAFPLTADVQTENNTDPQFFISLVGRF